MSLPVPTTVLFFDHTAKMGGGEISLFHIVTHLDRARFEPLVVLAEDGVLRERLCAVGVETHVFPLAREVTQVRKDDLSGVGALPWRQGAELVRYAWRLRAFARRRGAGLIHTNSLKSDLIGALVGRLAGLPVVWHVRDRIADDYLPSKATRAFRIGCRFLPDQIIVNSAATLEALELPPRKHAHVVHDGLPVPFPRPNPAHQNNAAPENASADGDANADAGENAAPVIGLVGRISPWKGQDVFLRAAAVVKERYPRARFQIIGAPLFGEEELERELRALSAELGLEANVEWLGFRDDVPQLLHGLTILAHASTTGEPFGQVVVEAMMAALPLVATRGGGVPEIVREEETGLLVPMKDAPAMAQALLRLLDDPQWAAKLGQAGQRRAFEHFTIEGTVLKISLVYDEVLRTHRASQSRWRFWLAGAALLVGAWRAWKRAPRA